MCTLAMIQMADAALSPGVTIVLILTAVFFLRSVFMAVFGNTNKRR